MIILNDLNNELNKKHAGSWDEGVYFLIEIFREKF